MAIARYYNILALVQVSGLIKMEPDT